MEDGQQEHQDHDNSNEDRMARVIEWFQKLLANMHCVPYWTFDTTEFLNALGLDHYEQQDPNEFSRLLLERMHDSFQQQGRQSSLLSSPSSSSSNHHHHHMENGDGRCGPNDLSTLLPHLFQGILVYKTTCLTCNKSSKRKEKFMDLNLPIEKITNDATKKNGMASTMLEWMQKSSRVFINIFFVARFRYLLEYGTIIPFFLFQVWNETTENDFS